MQCEFHGLKIAARWRKLLSPMKSPDQWKFATTTVLTRKRIIAAVVIAIAADGLQLCLGPLGWAFADQIIDVAAAILIVWLIGFHLLLLPTVVMEMIPGVDDLPTWTACVIAVIALRKRGQNSSAPPPDKPVIDI